MHDYIKIYVVLSTYLHYYKIFDNNCSRVWSQQWNVISNEHIKCVLFVTDLAESFDFYVAELYSQNIKSGKDIEKPLLHR